MFTATVRQKMRILDFDIECRPLGWYGGDFVHKEITAIAGKFIGTKKMYVWALGEVESEEMLQGFLDLYDQADMVTGHYIRGFDLPAINSACLDFGFKPLHHKLTQDTKNDLVVMSGLSKSMENLGSVLKLEHPKIQMNQQLWREANRLTKEGIALTKKRVVGDVEEHIELRERLIAQGMLGPPVEWSSVDKLNSQYTP